MFTSVFSLQFAASSSSRHHLMTRRVSDVVVLILGVPPWCDELHLKSVLSESCGGVKLIQFLGGKAETASWCSPTPPPIPAAPDATTGESLYFTRAKEVRFHDAVAVFNSARGAERLVERKREDPLVLRNETRSPLIGMRGWISDYSSRIISDWNHFQKDLDSYMMDYDAKKESEDATLKERGEVADDEGWVTVTNKSKMKGKRKKANNANKDDRYNAKAKAIGKNKELLHFYKFQKKEKKEDLIQNLREKFEEDKKRVATMRAERKFKPY